MILTLNQFLHIPFPLQIVLGLLIAFAIFGIPLSLKYKEHFFGWENIKWLIRELVKMYSKEESFFSYKRFQMGVAFFIYTQGSLWALSNLVHTIGDFELWAIPNLLIAGYTLNKVQQEKKDEKQT